MSCAHNVSDWQVCVPCWNANNPPSDRIRVLTSERRCETCGFVLSSVRTPSPDSVDRYELEIQSGRCRKCPKQGLFSRFMGVLR